MQKPVPPPIGPPELDSELVPKTITGSASGSPTSGGSSEGSSSTSSSPFSSSCSASPVTTCSNFCSTVSGSPSATETCTSTCTTVTTCSGTDSSTTTTANATQACSISAYWNDPAISASIASWISQFPFTFEDTMNMTLLSSATDISSSGLVSTVPMTSCTSALCTITTNGFTLTTGSVSSSLTNAPTSSPTTITTSSPTGTPITLTSTTRSFTDVNFLTCGGIEIGGSSSCTGSLQWASSITTTASPAETTEACAKWLPAQANRFTGTLTHGGECAAFYAYPTTSGVALTTHLDAAFPTPWNSEGAQFNWFNGDDPGWVEDFCSQLSIRDITIRKGEPDGKNSPGECINYLPREGVEISLADYGLTVTIAYDDLGCKPDDKYKNGIRMKEWDRGNKCRNTIMDNIVVECQVMGKDGAEWLEDVLKVPREFTTMGGVFWQDCMRFQVVAIRDDMKPPNTDKDHTINDPES